MPTQTPGTAAAVTATAGLMIVPGLTVVTAALTDFRKPLGLCGPNPQRAVTA